MPNKPKNKVHDKPEILTPRMIKARERAALILQGASYEEVARQTGVNPNAVNPRSNIYQSLRTETGQEALRVVASQYYDEAKVRRIINKYLDRLDSDKRMSPVQAKAMLELAARSLGMLTDKSEIVTEARQVKDIDRQAEDVLSSLSIGQDGVGPTIGLERAETGQG